MRQKKEKPKKPMLGSPYQVGDTVGIIRTRHGWFDGTLVGEVIEVSPSGETFSYVVHADGADYEVRRPRDLRRIK